MRDSGPSHVKKFLGQLLSLVAVQNHAPSYRKMTSMEFPTAHLIKKKHQTGRIHHTHLPDFGDKTNLFESIFPYAASHPRLCFTLYRITSFTYFDDCLDLECLAVLIGPEDGKENDKICLPSWACLRME